MALFSRYAIRIALLIAFVGTLSGIVALGFLVNAAQENINLVDERVDSYINLDQQILGNITEATNQVDVFIKAEESILIRTFNGEDTRIEVGGSLDQTRIAIRNANDMIIEREGHNYNISGLQLVSDNATVFNIAVPDLENIMERGDEGALSLIDEFGLLISANLLNISQQLNFERSNYTNEQSSFRLRVSALNQAFNSYQGSIQALIDSINARNSTYSAPLLNEIGHIQGNMSLLLSDWGELLNRYASGVIDVTFTSFQSSLSGIQDNVNQTYFSLLGSTIEANDSLLLNSTYNLMFSEQVGAVGILEVFDPTLQLMINIQSITQTLDQLLNTDLDNLEAQIDDLADQISSIVSQEATEFRQQATAFSSDLRIRVIDSSLIVLTIIGGSIGFIFLVVFLSLTSGIGRILSKNQSLARGDLRIKKRRRYFPTEIGVIERSIDDLAENLRNILVSIRSTSETLAGISEELAAGSEEAVASINEVSTTIREFSAGSSEQNLLLNRVRSNLIDHLSIIEQTTKQIDETAKFVKKVAKRTNILGLNASIESAKAGRYGLGFGVVAEEVRNLSNDTSESAEQIANRIEDIEVSIRKTVQDIMEEVGIVSEVAENTAAGSEEASASSSEQVIMMNEISETSNQLSELSASLNELLRQFTV